MESLLPFIKIHCKVHQFYDKGIDDKIVPEILHE